MDIMDDMQEKVNRYEEEKKFKGNTVNKDKKAKCIKKKVFRPNTRDLLLYSDCDDDEIIRKERN